MNRTGHTHRWIYYGGTLALAVVWLGHLTLSFGLVAYFCDSIDPMVLHAVSGLALLAFVVVLVLLRRKRGSLTFLSSRALRSLELFAGLLLITTFAAAIVNFFMPYCQK